MSLPTATWVDTVLNQLGDVQAEYPNVAQIAGGTNWQANVRAARRSAMIEIAERLTQDMRPIFQASSRWTFTFNQWLEVIGAVNPAQLDTLLDYIANPEALTSTTNACTLRIIWENKRSDVTAEFGINIEATTLIIKQWSDRFEERYKRALTVLRLDINRDGVVDNWERVEQRMMDISRS